MRRLLVPLMIFATTSALAAEALTLAKKAVDREAYNTYLRLIKNKAEDGNPLAQSALDKMGTKPM